MNQQHQPIMQNPRPAVAKWLWIVLVIVILAAGGVFWYFYYGPGKTSTTNTTTTTTTDKTAGWKTYADTNFNYSIKYPTNLTQSYASNNKTALFKETSKPNDPPILTIDVVSTPATLEQTLTEDASVFKNTQKTTVAGTSAYEGVGLGALSYYEIHLKNGNFLYKLIFNTNNKTTLDELKSGLSNIQSTMLSTFKFTTATSSTADWKTYTNSNYGYSVKYPHFVRENKVQNQNMVAFSDEDGGHWMEQITSYNDTESLETIVASAKNDLPSGDTVTSSDITVGGQPAVKWVIKFGGESDYGNLKIFVKKGNNFYEIDSDTSDTNFSKFLSSFQFTK